MDQTDLGIIKEIKMNNCIDMTLEEFKKCLKDSWDEVVNSVPKIKPSKKKKDNVNIKNLERRDGQHRRDQFTRRKI